MDAAKSLQADRAMLDQEWAEVRDWIVESSPIELAMFQDRFIENILTCSDEDLHNVSKLANLAFREALVRLMEEKLQEESAR